MTAMHEPVKTHSHPGSWWEPAEVTWACICGVDLCTWQQGYVDPDVMAAWEDHCREVGALHLIGEDDD